MHGIILLCCTGQFVRLKPGWPSTFWSRTPMSPPWIWSCDTILIQCGSMVGAASFIQIYNFKMIACCMVGRPEKTNPIWTTCPTPNSTLESRLSRFDLYPIPTRYPKQGNPTEWILSGLTLTWLKWQFILQVNWNNIDPNKTWTGYTQTDPNTSIHELNLAEIHPSRAELDLIDSFFRPIVGARIIRNRILSVKFGIA